MSNVKSKKNAWRNRLLITGLLLVIAAAVTYWVVATDTFGDTKEREAAYTVSALAFIREFQQDNAAANAKYAEKIITVNGRVSEVEAADTTLNIKFIDPATGSYAIFAFQQQYLNEARSVKPGDSISIKGSCSGGIYSEILEATSISFKRSALNK